MGAISLFVLDTICPACTATYVLSFISFVSIWAITTPGSLVQISDFKLYGVVGAVLLGFSYVVHGSFSEQYFPKKAQEMISFQFADWNAKPAIEIDPISPLQLNPNPNAKMKMVEFADFRCGHCATAFPIIHKFAKTHPDVELSFQAFPLDGECNPVIGRANNVSCFLARLSHCAGEQDKAWDAQEWMFKNQRAFGSVEAVKSKIIEATSLNLDTEALFQCADTDQTREIIRNQAKLGEQVGVKGTPSLYVNGKKIPGGFSIPLLKKIYNSL